MIEPTELSATRRGAEVASEVVAEAASFLRDILHRLNRPAHLRIIAEENCDSARSDVKCGQRGLISSRCVNAAPFVNIKASRSVSP